MPPSASIPLASIFLIIFWIVFGAGYAPAFGAGFVMGYLAYDMIHYHVHHHTPKTMIGRHLRESHMRHHFQDDDTCYGVSAPYWDYVFRTAPRSRRHS
jgi:sterol desaturase/sphingolipid hydroxylase (fatty acid hydroxylase superfamily)